jgi:TonB family protein
MASRGSRDGVATIVLLGLAALSWAGDSVSSTAAVARESDAFAKAEALAKAGHAAEAETAYREWFERNPRSVQACVHLAQAILLPPAGTPQRFDDGIAVFERCLPLEPDALTADRYQSVAGFYWEKAARDETLTDAQKDHYADRGIVFTDAALALKPNLFEAVIFKGLLFRVKARVAKNPARQGALFEESSRLQKQAWDLRNSGKAERTQGYVPYIPPPPPPRQTVPTRARQPTPVRVGGAIKEPRRVTVVQPVYPAAALEAGIHGNVILECTIGSEGKVTDVKVLRGIPLLDAAAMDAVRQWEYVPTLLNGLPVPVIMTVVVVFR